MKLKKVAAGEYRAGEFLIRKVDDEFGGKGWDILEDTPGGWVACDRLATLGDCFEMVKGWVTR